VRSAGHARAQASRPSTAATGATAGVADRFPRVGAPQTIGPYRVERLLGTGGFATVWLAYDPGLDARVAIKILADNWSHDPRVRERFVAEGRLLWQLDDERVLRVHGVGELEDGRPYLVMAWADRGSLADRLAQRPPPEPGAALAMLRAIADAVAVLHRRRIVHRDLTPANVLLRSRPDGSEQVLIGDLGLAKALATASGLTVGVGTPGFASPEQLAKVAVVDERADVYALGRLGQALLPDPAPGPLRALLDAATDPDPDRRPADASAFLTLLDAVTPTPSPAAANPGQVATADSPGRRRTRRRRQVGGAIAVTVALVGAGWLGLARAGSAGQASSGPLSVVLPARWSSTSSGWLPPGGSATAPEPAVVVSANPSTWATDPRVPGAFVGLSPSLKARRVSAAGFVVGRRHGSCAAPVPADWRGASGAVWSVATFPASCAGGRVYVEAASDQPSGVVYVQLGLPQDDPALAHAVLDGVRLS